MFDSLSGRLQEVVRKLRGQARISESNISETMSEIRLALLEADVNYQLVRDFIEELREECLGADVLRSVTPGQQLVKIVHDRLVSLMGEANAPLELDKSRPAVILLVGLHGGGKTTSCAKLALHLKKQGRRVMLAAGDIYRPAAIDQLEVLGRDLDLPVYADRNNPNVPAIGRAALDEAGKQGCDVLIFDTAGRLQIDDRMVMELVQLRQSVSPSEILLVADAALGQEAVSVAEHFHSALQITGVILTKLDGDARGGAALSIRRVADCPIKFVGVGEKLEDFELFHPDRMASRILGMGDVVSLVEKAAEEIDEEEAARMQEKLLKNSFDFNDFLDQIRQMRKLGGMESVLKMLPGMPAGGIPGFDETQFNKMEAAILSMTTQERQQPDIIDFPRRRRIAKGSGTSLELVGGLIKQFSQARKMMKKTGLLKRLMGGGGIPGGEGGLAGAQMPGLGRGSNVQPKKKKKKKKRRR